MDRFVDFLRGAGIIDLRWLYFRLFSELVPLLDDLKGSVGGKRGFWESRLIGNCPQRSRILRCVLNLMEKE